MKRKLPQAIRRAVAVRAGGVPGELTRVRCAYCPTVGVVRWFRRLDGQPYAWLHLDGLEIDHVVPEHLGGTDDVDNLTLACTRCNRRKNYRRTASEMLAGAAA